LYYMMSRLDFSNKWIKTCLELSTISVLINGNLKDEFKDRRRLRQRDPMIQFLFLIIVEGLEGLVREAKRKNILKGVKVGRKEV